MTRSPLWREFESGDGALLKALRFLVLAGGLIFLCFTATLLLDWRGQLMLALLTSALALWIHWSSGERLATLALMLLSGYSTLRYGFWRAATVVAYLREPGAHPPPLSVFFTLLLLGAECYAFAVLLLGYLQAVWPLERAPAPLPDDADEWPAVDVLIPTLNEPLSLVRFTVLAAMNIDWPAERLNIVLLDDGAREEFRAFAAEAGIEYMAREERSHAKAGNINHALRRTSAPFVAVFDCDHAPTRSFLQLTMGWLLRDAKLAMVQTPHRYYSPDPFERNLDQFHVAPSEDQLFYGVVQDGNDLWNAACFCGSCAVLRRTALDDVGGLATETLTEDAHTSLRMQRRGWNTAYINIPQAAGLATERLSEHIRQRIRWARGMVQILRMENPLLGRGLTPAQRLCYFNAMAHFLCALPRLIFLTAPAIYLVFGVTTLPGVWAAIAVYAAPHLLLAYVTHSRIHGKNRHSFWNEIYETVLAPYILLPTLLALLFPRWGRFNVTAKGGVVDEEFYDTRIARPFLLLLAFNFVALACALPRAVRFPAFAVQPEWLSAAANWPARLYDGGHPGVVGVNVAWALFNVAVLGVATGLARESQQRRQSVRMARAVPSDVVLADGSMLQGVTCDLSSGGVRARLSEQVKATAGDAVQFVFPMLDGSATLAARVVSVEGSEMRARFERLGLKEDEALAMLLYSRADAWLGWGEASDADRPLRSMGRMARLSLRGLRQTFHGSSRRKSGLASSVLPMVVAAVMLGGAWRSLGAQGGNKAGSPVISAQATWKTGPAVESAQGARKASVVGSTTGAAQAAASPVPDLSDLPRPFLSPGTEAQTVAIVFLAQPSAKAMRAAGVVASWLGVMSDARAVRFAVTIGTVPAGNAMVFAENAAEIPAAMGAGAIASPTVLLRKNPSEANSSVLLLAGNDADQLLTAAMALALHGDTWHGEQVTVGESARPAPRAPDDAPRWLSTEKSGAVNLGQAEIDGDAGELQGDGSTPLRATLRLPPDLYFRDGDYRGQKNLALHLDYRYNGVPLGDGSTLQVYVNGAFVSSTPMPHTEKASQVLETVVPVPVVDLRPSENTLTFQFAFVPAKAGGALEGAVLKDSWLDVAGIPHWTELPNLELFADAGYPFTRRADLANTAVVLPAQPSSAELDMFLAMMARFGAQTGFPALNVTVSDAAGMTADDGKDHLVLGTAADQPALQTLNAELPVAFESGGLRVRDASGFFNWPAWQSAWPGTRRGKNARFGQMETAGELPDAVMEEIEWPRGSGRTALVIALRDTAAAEGFVDASAYAAARREIAQSVSVLHGARVSSYRMGGEAYWVGAISPLQRMEFALADAPWLVAIVAVIFCWLMAVLLQAMLRRRARERLQTPV